eukprot:1332244-Amorphochlora_amoeboformis.AAC.2
MRTHMRASPIPHLPRNPPNGSSRFRCLRRSCCPFGTKPFRSRLHIGQEGLKTQRLRIIVEGRHRRRVVCWRWANSRRATRPPRGRARRKGRRVVGHRAGVRGRNLGGGGGLGVGLPREEALGVVFLGVTFDDFELALVTLAVFVCESLGWQGLRYGCDMDTYAYPYVEFMLLFCWNTSIPCNALAELDPAISTACL